MNFFTDNHIIKKKKWKVIIMLKKFSVENFKGFRSIGKILTVHFGHRKLIFLRNLPAIRGHQFFAQLVAVFDMDIGAIASRVKPVPFCQGSVGKNDSAGCLLYTSRCV